MGVGHIPDSLAVPLDDPFPGPASAVEGETFADRDDDDAPPEMGSTQGGSRNTRPPSIVPESGKVPEDLVESEIAKVWNVFDEDVRGEERGCDDLEARPEPPGVFRPELGSGDADGLAGETSAEESDVGSGLASPPLDCSADVVMAGYLRPVLFEDRAGERVNLYLTDGLEAHSLQPQLQAADAREQREVIQVHGARSRKGMSELLRLHRAGALTRCGQWIPGCI